MSRLDELIQQYCPDGVEYRKLGDTNGCNISTGKGVTKTDIVSDGKYDIVSGGKDPLGKIDIYNREGKNVTIARAGSAGLVLWHEKPFYLNDKCFSIIPKDDSIDTKYLYYTLKNIEYKIIGMKSRGTVPTVNTQHIASLEIPVPPLPVQEEIVRILDKFTELEQELEQELELRKKQYEYYRDKMLSLSDYDGEVEYVELNTIADVKDGTHDSPKPSFDDDAMYLLTSKNVKKGIINYDGAYRISKKDYDAINQRSKVDIFDLLFTMIGTVGEIGLVSNIPDYAIKNVGLIKTNGNELLSKFLRYYLTTSMANQYINANKSKGSQVFFSLGKLRAFPVPKIDEDTMQEIVEKLDKFSTLTSDISEGLPAEIKMRHQQYEYYRDKLLNFKRLEVA